jgi:hypothetical protein
VAVTYFGNNDNGATANNMFAYTWWLAAGYVCPGSVLQNLVTLDLNISAVASGNVRCAIYTAAGVFVAQWDTEKDPSGAGWLAVTSFVDRSGTPITPQLTGGDSYLLVSTGDGTVSYYYDTVASGLVKIDYTDYTGGFPVSLGPSDQTREPCIRCGVEPPSGGGGPAIPGTYALDAFLKDSLVIAP